ncbi:hypothetical protein BKA93DRAFT_11284 [Sparassis latifolia]
MHAVSHTLSHRGPSASRARTRWQPYSAIALPSTTPTHTRNSPVNYLNTPASSVFVSPQTSDLNSAHELDRLKGQCLSQPSLAGHFRDVQKSRYVTRLVDQAVKSLCDIWDQEDIPHVFNTPVRNPCTADSVSIPRESCPGPVSTALFSARNIQLPSPITPTTRPSPLGCRSDSFAYTRHSSADSSRGTNLVPIKGFVHEVLRRSRTSAGVLQTALCYLEAVRSKIPEILRKEKSRQDEDEDNSGNDAPVVLDVVNPTFCDTPHGDDGYQSHKGSYNFDSFDAARVADGSFEAVCNTDPQTQFGLNYPTLLPCSSSQTCSPSIPPLPPLPSPLLCPRRTFLACLILASKFMQDRSYSNRAWAKLAGLPPREIGRCERALGDALGWRLWVGKSVNRPANGRSVARSSSDGNLLPGPTSAAASETRLNPSTSFIAPTPVRTLSNTTLSGLRRYATMPTIPVRSSASNYEAFPEVLCATCGLPEDADANTFAAEMEATQPSEDVSPSMSTPTLTFSPMSSASSSSDSSGDRTIQMTTFTDLPTASPATFRYAPFVSGWDHTGVAATDLSIDTKAYNVPEFAMAGPKLPAIDPTVASRGPCNLPSLSDTLSVPYDNLYTYWTV